MDLLKKTSLPVYLSPLALAGVGYLVYYLFGDSNGSSEENDTTEENVQSPPGIVNFGNICFVNSSLQALASIRSFREFLIRLIAESRDLNNDQSDLPLIKELKIILSKLNKDQEDSLTAEELINKLKRLEHFLNFQDQQDAHELICMIFDTISKVYRINTLNKYNMSLSGIHKLPIKKDFNENLEPKEKIADNGINPIQGLLSRCYECCTCGYKFNIKLEAFNCLSVDIVPSGISNVLDSLKYLLKEELIEDVICINCSLKRFLEKLGDHLLVNNANESLSSCFQEQISLVKSLIEKNKRMLIDNEDMEQNIIDLKRKQIAKMPGFEKSLSEPFIKKKGVVRSHNVIISFPKKYSSEDLKEVFCVHFKRLVNSPQGPIKSSKSIDFPEILDLSPLNSKDQFTLKAVIIHHGMYDYGHYIAIRKVNNRWFFISDENVDVMTYPNSLEEYKSKAYMLFYEKSRSGFN